MKRSLVFLLGFLLWTPSLRAEEIEFPTDELQQETVLPKFDDPAVVRNRSVVLQDRFEIGGLFGGTFNIPFYEVFNIGALATFHMNETHALQLLFSAMSARSDQFAEQLDGPGFNYHFKSLPQPKMLFLGAYEVTPYYGKLSVAKQAVANLTTSVNGGLGVLQTGTRMNPVLGLGVNQRFFMSNRWGFSLDLRALFYSGPRPSMKRNGTAPAESDLSSTLTTSFLFNGVVFFLL